MRKRKTVVIFLFMTITLSFYGAYKAFDAYRENVCENESLLLKNVEALASGTNAEGGLVIGHWCSRKPGSVLCTQNRGYRKWALGCEVLLHGSLHTYGKRLHAIGNTFEI